MDWIARGRELATKYRYVLLVVLLGVGLMLLPTGSRESAPESGTAPQTQRDLQEDLAQMLSHLEGAGKVRVLLTEAEGESTYYQSDEDTRTDSAKTDTVLITGSDRGQTGLVRRVDPPRYQGAVVLCQGADRASVRLAVVEAVANATGLPSNRISVLKLK